MSNFWRRLRYYGIGFGIGLIFVIFFFNNRGCSWTPSNRVKTAILERVFAVPESQIEQLTKQKVDVKDLEKFIQEADVDFNASKKTDDNKYYKLSTANQTLFFTLTNESFVTSVFTSKPKASDWQKGKAKLVRFPKGKDLIFTDTTGSQQRQRMELGFKNDQEVWKQLKKNALLDYEKSDFVSAIKPEHYLTFQSKKGKEFSVLSVWYKEKINITEYIVSDSLE